MRSANTQKNKLVLGYISTVIYASLGILFTLSATGIALAGVYDAAKSCISAECNIVTKLLNLVSCLIISVAIFDVGRYLVEEELFRERELHSPQEARQSLTKFMVIVVIAVTLEALITIIKATTSDITQLVYPSILFFSAVSLLVGLGGYQRLSVLTEFAIKESSLKR